MKGMLLAVLVATGLMLPDGAPSPQPVPPPAAVAGPLTDRWAAAPRGSSYDWPTGERVAVLRGFEPPSVPWGTGHRGVDLALDTGAPVYAAADGVVAFAGTVVDRPVLSIDHADGIRTTHEPVVAAVAVGDMVKRGDLVGTLAPGHCASPCLHFGARTGPKSYIDPLLLFGDAPVRLLPW
jgi:murein DD-endopeptidase MepM/ murein hydrolase activator NlpD